VNLLNLTLPTPAENLACDEALLDLCEEDGAEILRFWESHRHFVVIGYANKVESEVNVEECQRRQMRVLRRCTGGGTVVQGPGCLNYALTLRIPEQGPLTTVTGTNEFIMERNRMAIEQLLGSPVAVKGHTDLAFEERLQRAGDESATIWRKFSGNAQRRRRRALIFHGTLLHGFDLSLLDAVLKFPSIQPSYRADRPHSSFVRNIPLSADQLRRTIRDTWNVEQSFELDLSARIDRLVRDQYGNEDWNLRR
jgi:lipoate---protein ligase